MSAIIRKLLNPLMGKKSLQGVFEKIHYLGLLGMNYNNIHFEQNGELALVKYLQKQLTQNNQENLVLFDVGANVGNYAQVLAAHFPDKADIYCFEPAKLSFEKLKAKFEHIHHVKCFQMGMGEEEAQRTLYSNKSLSGFASVYQRDLAHHQESMEIQEEIQLQSLDNFCTAHKITHIDFLKLDVEGHEIAVLKGAEQCLKDKKIQSIQFEFGGCNIDSRTYFRDFWHLLNENYQIYRIVRNGLQPINNYNEKLEIFSYANFFAMLK